MGMIYGYARVSTVAQDLATVDPGAAAVADPGERTTRLGFCMVAKREQTT
jgi:hypothetical protein